MRANKHSVAGDLSFLALLLLLFLCLVYTGMAGEGQWAANLIMFSAVSAALLATYFISVTAGLIADLLLLFAYVSYVIVTVMQSGEPVNEGLYFWIFWTPLMTLSVHFFSRSMTRLQRENEVLSELFERYAAIDEETGLKNLYYYERECEVYMRIAERYDMELLLLVWDLRYEHELKRLLGQRKFASEIAALSAGAQQHMRAEDTLFLLGEDPHLFGTLMFAKDGGEQAEAEALIAALKQAEAERTSDTEIELRFGKTFYQKNGQTPLELLEAARRRLTYDVPGGEK